MAKVTIIGATGNVGMFAAHTVSEIPYVNEMLLVGKPGREDFLGGCCHDLSDSFAARGTHVRLSYSTCITDAENSDIIICTAGVPRKPGQDRNDLALENAKIVAETAETIGKCSPDAILFMVTNPVDVMTAVAMRYSGLPPQRVFGLGTHLDSMRLKSLIARYFRVHVSEVHTRIIGEHGESMVPLWSATTIGGIQIHNLPTFSGLPAREMMDTVRTSGQAIIRDKGSTIYGPGKLSRPWCERSSATRTGSSRYRATSRARSTESATSVSACPPVSTETAYSRYRYGSRATKLPGFRSRSGRSARSPQK